jgi:hypothetical protein
LGGLGKRGGESRIACAAADDTGDEEGFVWVWLFMFMCLWQRWLFCLKEKREGGLLLQSHHHRKSWRVRQNGVIMILHIFFFALCHAGTRFPSTFSILVRDKERNDFFFFVADF